ncbi:hypothetical protein Tco_1354618 [Tanacetum coccineum]
MASESTSSQQSQQLLPSLKVNFKCEDGIIAFNNVVALLEHPNELYRPMLSFLSNCCISKALTSQPSTMYVEYLKEFWYTVEIDIGAIIFSDLIHKLQNGKKNRETNICYTRFLSLIFEKLLGGNYISNDLTLVKPHTITTASFQKPLASEVPLTSHMLKVAKLSEEPEQSLIPPSGEVNADDTADKSLSRASVQPVTQPKAPTDLKTKKKRIPPSSKPKSPYKVRVILPKKQVAETQHAEVTVATADATKSLVASELAEEQVNQPSAAEAEKVLDQNIEEEVKDAGFVAMEEVTFEQIMDELIQRLRDEINITPKDAKEGEASKSLSGLRSMPDDDLASVFGFETQDSADLDSQESTAETFHASADKPAQSDPLGHLHEELCLLHNKVQKNLQDQLPNILLKLMYKEFNAFNKLESQRFVLLQKELSKSLHNKMSKSIRLKDFWIMIKDMVSLFEATEVFKKANAEGEKGQPSSQVVPNVGQVPPVNEEKALVLHTLEEKSSEKDTSGKKETDDEPLAKKLKFLIPSSSIPSPTLLKSIMPDPPKVTEAIKITMDQFTEHLSKTTSSIYTPTPPREPTLPRDPTPPRDKSKGKAIATEDPLKEIIPFIEEGGSAPTISCLKSFVIPEGPLSQEDVMAQLKEMKRLADLKAEKERSEEYLKKILRNPATIRARTQKMAEHEAKRKKMLDEYNHQISYRADHLPIIKISYKVNSSKEASMRITRGNDPLNVTVHERFRLKTLVFSEWLEVHPLASKGKGKSNDMLLQSLRAKFEWVLTQAKSLGIPPLPELSTFGVDTTDKKRKRSSEILKEVFVKENVEVDGMRKNLVLPLGIEGRQGLVIREPESKAEKMITILELSIEARDDAAKARIISEAMKGLSECKASESNIRRIQVKDIIKKVKDHLKTYSSSGMDISWYVEGIR